MDWDPPGGVQSQLPSVCPPLHNSTEPTPKDYFQNNFLKQSHSISHLTVHKGQRSPFLYQLNPNFLGKINLFEGWDKIHLMVWAKFNVFLGFKPNLSNDSSTQAANKKLRKISTLVFIFPKGFLWGLIHKFAEIAFFLRIKKQMAHMNAKIKVSPS